MAQLRELIDAGVFVFTGGSPRTKTKDSDPILQFKLTFRRIYGLTNSSVWPKEIGSSCRVPNLEEWLSNPAAGKEILMRNLGGPFTEEGEPRPAIERLRRRRGLPNQRHRHCLIICRSRRRQNHGPGEPASGEGEPHGQAIHVAALAGGQVAALTPREIVLGLGFEDRTLESVREIARTLPPAKVFAIQYEDPGKSKEILDVLKRWGAGSRASAVRRLDEKRASLVGAVPDRCYRSRKAGDFHTVRHSLRNAGSVLVTHTQAKSYYPTDGDMKALLKAEEQHNRQKFFDTLSGILTGEIGPYQCISLLQPDADETRRNVLFAFASPKHERLLSLIDGRVIDRLEVVAPDGTSARNHVAQAHSRNCRDG